MNKINILIFKLVQIYRLEKKNIIHLENITKKRFYQLKIINYEITWIYLKKNHLYNFCNNKLYLFILFKLLSFISPSLCSFFIFPYLFTFLSFSISLHFYLSLSLYILSFPISLLFISPYLCSFFYLSFLLIPKIIQTQI